MRINRVVLLSLSAGVSLTGSVVMAADSLLFENSDFEKGTLENWAAEGDAFTGQPTKGDNPRLRGKGSCRQQGEYWIGTFENYDGRSGRPGRTRGDKATGTLTSTPFTVKKRFITFKVGGGSNAAELGVRLLHNGKETVMASGRGSEAMRQVSFDASRFLGEEVRLVVYDNAKGGWGHVNVDDFRASDTLLGSRASAVIGQKLTGTLPPGVMDPRHRTFASYMDVGYDQPFRAQFHFSSRKNWLNDPNGMVYYDGEYHLYFQHHALGLGPGPKSWGHAVSTDMVHWEQLPHAILPYSGGAIWSGTAVVDHNNSLGKQVGDTKTIVAYFTKTQAKPKHFIQAAAYSTDRGRTFTLIRNGEAVVPNQGFSHGERDPKVFWHEATRKWIMVLILGGRERVIRFFSSDNMVDWEKAGDIRRRWAAECIDLFQLPVDGNKRNMKWVIADASYDYEVGEFNGTVFTSTQDTQQGDFGTRCFYAAQVFNNGPGGRVVQIGWMKEKGPANLFLPNDMPFNQQMSFPTDLTLRTTPKGIRLFRWPIAEIKGLYVRSHSFRDPTVRSANEALADVRPELVDMSIEFEPGADEIVTLSIRGLEVVYGRIKKYRTRKGETREVKSFAFGGRMVPAPIIDGKVKLRVLVDRTAIELFANDGAAVGTIYAAPASDNRDISIKSDGAVRINSIEVHELRSAWRDAK